MSEKKIKKKSLIGAETFDYVSFRHLLQSSTRHSNCLVWMFSLLFSRFLSHTQFVQCEIRQNPPRQKKTVKVDNSGTGIVPTVSPCARTRQLRWWFVGKVVIKGRVQPSSSNVRSIKAGTWAMTWSIVNLPRLWLLIGERCQLFLS